MASIRGRVWLFGDDLNTDVIHPPEFFSLDPEKVKRGLFGKLDASIQPRIQQGDVIVGGRNFGCGSSRETSIRSLLLNGIGAVVAVDFARIFFRNATNNGLPCLVLTDANQLSLIRNGQEVAISTEKGLLETSVGDQVGLQMPGRFVQQIWSAGGLLGLLPKATSSPHGATPADS
jgi:3-isopropylmalate/(R)-2-methylmalate dehydratase small subunit